MRFSRVLHYFKSFKKLFSLSLRLIQIQRHIFCCFPSIFLKGFYRLAPVRLICPLFFGLISFFMHLRENFEPIEIWGFWWFRQFLSKLINGFLLLDDINMFFTISKVSKIYSLSLFDRSRFKDKFFIIFPQSFSKVFVV